MSNSKTYQFENQFTLENCVGRVVIAVVGHPFDFVKTLIQLGYEPLPPYPTTTIFGRHRLALPGVFRYIGHIRRTDGLCGIYRGIGYKLTSVLVNGFIYVNLSEYLKHLYPEEESLNEDKKDEDKQSTPDLQKYVKLCQYLSRETASRFVALLASYPFQVMTVRVCAQFVGRETHYDTLFGAIKDIYRTGGVSGFYAGFMPRFLGDVLVLWIGSNIIFVANSWIDGDSTTKNYVSASVNFIVSSLLYPFQLVSTVMSCNGQSARSLAASAYTGHPYANWVDCWRHLSQLGEIKRGSSLLWRYQSTVLTAPLIHSTAVDRETRYRPKEW
ncbi:mitochondrial carrier homolog 2-like [Oppia nitens]|uniref:mitochondrial carrier homolog 2-like n=1 Tax=Oppia nitens TaxID=1686743 RepID=UPI0023DB06B4|nr:mitochondrial carrier homolog 2-like [Oppia nitens]